MSDAYSFDSPLGLTPTTLARTVLYSTSSAHLSSTSADEAHGSTHPPPNPAAAGPPHPPCPRQNVNHPPLHQVAQSNPSTLTLLRYLFSLTPSDDAPSLEEPLHHFPISSLVSSKDPWTPQTDATLLGHGASSVVEKRYIAPWYPGRQQFVARSRMVDLFRGKRRPRSSWDGWVAVKRVRLDTADTAELLREIRIATHAPLRRHKNVAGLIGFVADMKDGVGAEEAGIAISLVIELAAHGTLRDYLGKSQRNMKLDEMAGIIADVADGLAALHECGIVWGDVKLENVLVYDSEQPGGITGTSDGQSGGRRVVVRLSDFGHSIVVDRNGVCGRERYRGTTIFNAPEVRGRRRRNEYVDVREFYKCDVFSFGLLVYEIILGGRRYIDVLKENNPVNLALHDDAEEGIVDLLNTLAKDALLQMAVRELEVSWGVSNEDHDSDHQRSRGDHDHNGKQGQSTAVVDVVARVLKGTMRDDPEARMQMEEVLETLAEVRSDIDGPRYRMSDYADRIILAHEDMILEEWSVEKSWSSIFYGKHFPRPLQVLIVTHLLDAATSAYHARRASISYNLALAHFTGFGLPSVSIEKGLFHMREAANLGSLKALAVVRRLHIGLISKREDAERLLEQVEEDRDIRKMEEDLDVLTPQVYLSERLWRFERVWQKMVLNMVKWDVYGGSTERQVWGTAVGLAECAEIIRQLPEEVDPVSLKCCINANMGVGDLMDEYPPNNEQPLLVFACRLGLLDLITQMLTPKQPLPESLARLAIAAASRGGHLHVLKFLLSRPIDGTLFSPHMPDGTPLHWLPFFPLQVQDSALSILLNAMSTTLSSGYLTTNTRQQLDCHLTKLSGTPLDFAVAVGNYPLVKLLLQAGATQDGNICYGFTDVTFEIAVASRRAELVMALAPHVMRYRTICSTEQPALAVWARMRRIWAGNASSPQGLWSLSIPAAKQLTNIIAHGADWDSEGVLGKTIDVILKVEMSDINTKCVELSGSTVLSMVIQHADLALSPSPLITALASRGARFGPKEPKTKILRAIAARTDPADVKREIVRALLANNLWPDTELMDLAWAAVQALCVPVLSPILDHMEQCGIDINSPVINPEDQSLRAPLLHAAALSAAPAEVIRLLLARGADVDAVEENNLTALEYAMLRAEDRVPLIDELIQHNASLLSQTKGTVLHIAVQLPGTKNGVNILSHLLKHDRVRRFLTEHTATMSPGGVTPLHLACLRNSADAVIALFDAGMEPPTEAYPGQLRDLVKIASRAPHQDPLWKNFYREKSKQQRLYEWQLQSEKIILKLEDVMQPDHDLTPLHIACELGNLRRVMELVERDHADLFAMDKRLLTPLALVQSLLDAVWLPGEEEEIEKLRAVSGYLHSQMKI